MKPEQIDQIVLDELLDYWRMNEKDIENLFNREKEVGELPLHQKGDLEDCLDRRLHLKEVIKYCTHRDQRKKLNLAW
jgi:hypothetical protein